MSLPEVTPAAGDGVDWTFPAKRRSELLRLAKAQGSINVADLAAQFSLSADTIRRDLTYLEKRGLVTRTHGGAVPAESLLTRDAPIAQRLSARSEEKAKIAREAASLVGDGDTLLIYGGSTTRAFVAALSQRRDLTIVTNDFGIPLVLPPNVCRALYVLGGQVLEGSQLTVGAVGFPNAGPIRADKALLGVGGISAQGLSTSVLAEASMMLGMLDAAQKTIVLADSSKLGRSAFAHVAPLDRIDILVTDAVPAPALAAAFDDAGIDTIVAR